MAKGKYKEWLTEDGLAKLADWAGIGLTDVQIAHNMGITPKTLYEWKKSYSNLCEVLKNNKIIADLQVENALYKRACGYSYKETKTEMAIDENGNKYVKNQTITTKEVAPDVTAQIYWLKNRQPTKWRDRQEIVTIEEQMPTVVIDDTED